MSAHDTLLLTQAALDPAALEPALADPGCGAVVSFVGRVRDEHLGRAVLYLDYEAFEPLARSEMAQWVAQARARWGLGPVLVAHRLGRLAIGEVAIVIAVSSGHRGEAFEACRFLIEGIKASVPIWKHEFYADGSEAWVGAPGWKEVLTPC